MDFIQTDHSRGSIHLPVARCGTKILAFLNCLRFWKKWKTWQKALGLVAVAAAGALGGCAVVVFAIVVIVGCTLTRCTYHSNASIDPPASELAYFDAARASLTFSLVNSHLTTSIGNVKLIIRDHATGQIIGSKTFAYNVNSNVATFAHPSLVDTWVHSFSDYGHTVDVRYSIDDQPLSVPAEGKTASVTSVAIYKGSPVASGAAVFAPPPPGGGGGCRNIICRPKVIARPVNSSAHPAGSSDSGSPRH